MTQKTHYFKIGLFVIGATSLAVAGIVILGAGKWFQKVMMVETYFIESVQGLEVGAPVRIRGVPVGRVESIGLAREEYGLIVNPEAGIFPFKGVVVVRMSVRPGVAVQHPDEDPTTRMKMAVDGGFRFRLASQGITGVLYVESEFLDPERYPPMEIAWTPKTIYVPSAPSTITELGADLRSITRKLDQIEIDKITKDLDTMLTSVTQFVQEVQSEHLGTEVKQVMSELRGTVQEARSVIDSPHVGKALKDSALAMDDIRRTAADLSHTAKDVREAMAQLPEIMTRLNRSLRRVDTLLATKGEAVDDLLDNLRSVSEELRYLTRTVEKYPSQVLFGEPPPHSVKR
ncbi:MAG TPA: MlaD family protein [Nitrospira sp.]|nr:MlaD family protein [Nitrospira sp.]